MKLTAFVTGLVLGATSWAVVPLISTNFEPFDSGTGFLIGQVAMSAGALYFAYAKGIKNILLYTLGIYAGQNLYAYAFGTSATRAWAGLLLITSIALCVFPVIAAVVGKTIFVLSDRSKKHNNAIKKGV